MISVIGKQALQPLNKQDIFATSRTSKLRDAQIKFGLRTSRDLMSHETHPMIMPKFFLSADSYPKYIAHSKIKRSASPRRTKKDAQLSVFDINRSLFTPTPTLLADVKSNSRSITPGLISLKSQKNYQSSNKDDFVNRMRLILESKTRTKFKKGSALRAKTEGFEKEEDREDNIVLSTTMKTQQEAPKVFSFQYFPKRISHKVTQSNSNDFFESLKSEINNNPSGRFFSSRAFQILQTQQVDKKTTQNMLVTTTNFRKKQHSKLKVPSSIEAANSASIDDKKPPFLLLVQAEKANETRLEIKESTPLEVLNNEVPLKEAPQFLSTHHQINKVKPKPRKLHPLLLNSQNTNTESDWNMSRTARERIQNKETEGRGSEREIFRMKRSPRRGNSTNRKLQLGSSIGNSKCLTDRTLVKSNLLTKVSRNGVTTRDQNTFMDSNINEQSLMTSRIEGWQSEDFKECFS